MARRSRSSGLGGLITLLIAGAIFYYLIWRNPATRQRLLDALHGIGKGGAGKTAPKGKVSAPSGGGPSSAASTGTCGKTIYPATGRTQQPGDKTQSIHYASSGKQTMSRRINAENVPFSSYEATWYFSMNGQNCGKGYNQATIKMWGPSHSDSNCCWALVVLDDNGKLSFGGEGPHPQTSTSQKGMANLGNLKGKSLGLKAVIWPLASGGAHQEAWVDLGTGWKKMGTLDRPTVGLSKTETKPAANQEVEFRIDCVGVTVKCATVAEIKAGGAAAAAAAVASVAEVSEVSEVSDDDCGWTDDEYESEVLIPALGLDKIKIAV